MSTATVHLDAPPDHRRWWWLLVLILLPCFALVPIYRFSSGGFQLVDFAVIMLAVTLLFFDRSVLDRRVVLIMLVLGIFTAWMSLIELLNFAYDSSFAHLTGVAQKLYALLLLWTFSRTFSYVLRMPRRDEILLAIFSLASITVFFSTGVRGDRLVGGVRAAMSFNNPIQLAYYSILLQSAIIVTLAGRVARFSLPLKVWLIGLVGVVHFLNWMSLSRSGIAALLVLDVLLIIRMAPRPRTVITVLALTATLGVGIYATMGERIEQSRAVSLARVAYLITRLQGEKVSADFQRRLLERYEEQNSGDALRTYFGRGKPNTAQTSEREVHNTFGETLLEGGLIGLALQVAFFASILVFVTRRAVDNRGRLVAAGIFAILVGYNMVQVGFRFRMFWIFLGLWIATVLIAEARREEPARVVGT